MFCEHCGKQMDEGSVFCGYCGKKSSSEGTGTQIEMKRNSENNSSQQLPWVTNQSHNDVAETVNVRPNTNTPPTPHSHKEKVTVQNIVIFLLLAVIMVGGFFVWKSMGTREQAVVDNVNIPIEDESVAQSATPAPAETSTPTPLPSPTIDATDFDMERINSIISSKTTASNVAVAIMDLASERLFTTSNAETPFVAAGFYAPLYMALYNSGETDAMILEKANVMMTTMDNSAANAIIDNLGGLQGTNSVLRNNGYTKTVFNRKFGDVEASKRGNENYTTAKEAALILGQLYDDGGYRKMNTDLRKDNISLPSVGSIYAHRGMGIGTSFNVFAVIVAPSGRYSIAILTTGTGNTAETAKDNAVPIISELFVAISEQLGNSDE